MFKAFVIGIIFTVVGGAACVYAVLRLGIIPAAANGNPILLERWAARTSLRATLMNQAPKGPNPIALTDDNLVTGIQLYGQHCAICHGTAVGNASKSPIAKGEYPNPPQLGSDGVEDDPDGWTFWKIENGIRWTGMPGWKDSLTDRQMWAIALFLKHMDKLPPAAQQAWQAVKNGPSQ
jgi:thiosulfate dehydrogenase